MMGAPLPVLVALLASLSRAQAAAPPVGPLPLDTYPAGMREVMSAAERRARAHPADADAAGALGQALHAWEQWAPAHDAYSRAADFAPAVFAWPYLDACVLQRLGRQAEAAERLRRALAIAPEYLPARVKLAEALLDTGAMDDSQRLFESLIAVPAAEPAARFGLGRIAAAAGRHEQAVTFFDRAIDLYPEWGAAYYALALSLRALGRTEDAQRAMERHTRFGARWPGLEDAVLAAVVNLRDDAASMLRHAEELAVSGDLPGAIRENEKALARDPSLAVAHERLLILYGRMKDWDKAEVHYREALRIGSSLADIHYDHGVLLEMQGQWDLAGEAYRQACDINPLHAPAHNNLGQVLERTGNFQAALEQYRLALDGQPTFRLARFNLGRALVALGQPADAILELSRLTELRDSESPRYLFALGVAYMRAGNTDDGVRWSTEARRLATEYGQVELAAAIDQELKRLK